MKNTGIENKRFTNHDEAYEALKSYSDRFVPPSNEWGDDGDDMDDFYYRYPNCRSARIDICKNGGFVVDGEINFEYGYSDIAFACSTIGELIDFLDEYESVLLEKKRIAEQKRKAKKSLKEVYRQIYRILDISYIDSSMNDDREIETISSGENWKVILFGGGWSGNSPSIKLCTTIKELPVLIEALAPVYPEIKNIDLGNQDHIFKYKTEDGEYYDFDCSRVDFDYEDYDDED